MEKKVRLLYSSVLTSSKLFYFLNSIKYSIVSVIGTPGKSENGTKISPSFNTSSITLLTKSRKFATSRLFTLIGKFLNSFTSHLDNFYVRESIPDTIGLIDFSDLWILDRQYSLRTVGFEMENLYFKLALIKGNS